MGKYLNNFLKTPLLINVDFMFNINWRYNLNSFNVIPQLKKKSVYKSDVCIQTNESVKGWVFFSFKVPYIKTKIIKYLVS